MKKILLAMLVCAAMPLLHANEVYRNAALNPVKFAPVPEHAPLELVKDGKLNFVIARDMKAEKKSAYSRQSIRFAVEALTEAFERTTGSKPKVLDASSPELARYPVVIAVGKSVITDKLGMDPLAGTPSGKFTVKTFDKYIVIAGYDGSLVPGSYNNLDWTRYRFNGTSNGAYDFCERIIGMRYYYPGIGVYVPQIKNLTVQPVEYSDEPYFQERYSYAYQRQFTRKWPWKGVKKDAARFDRAWRMDIENRYAYGHTPNPQSIGKAFPELREKIFYKNQAGHLYYQPHSHIGNLFDVTNPEFVTLLVEWAKKFYATNGEWRTPWKGSHAPNSEFFPFGQADTFIWNMRNKYSAPFLVPERAQIRSGIYSDVYADFYCRLARELAKELPGKKLGVFFYHSYTMPPVLKHDFPENLYGTVCMGNPAFVNHPVSRKAWAATYGGWAKALGRGVGTYHYADHSNAFTSAVQGAYAGRFYNYLKQWLWRGNNMFDGGHNWHFYYSFYPLHRAQWNPDFDSDAAIAEHWELLYGKKAGPLLKEFYDLIRDRWDNYVIPNLKSPSATRTEPATLYAGYNKQVIDKLEKLLNDAKNATAPGSVERLRWEFFAKPWPKEFAQARSFHSNVIPEYKAAKLFENETITLDGVLDEKAWARGKTVPLREFAGNNKPLNRPSEFKILWNEQGLYLGVTQQGKAQVQKGNIWFKSDNVEFFVSPGRDKSDYFQFATSSANDSSHCSRTLKPIPTPRNNSYRGAGVKSAVKVTDNNWTLELFVPFKAMHAKAPATYESWFTNVVVNDNTPQAAQTGSWSLTMRRNHDVDTFGKIKFMGREDLSETKAAPAAAAPAAPAVDSAVKALEVRRNYHTHSRSYDKARYFEIKNDLNTYMLYFQWTKATPKSGSKVLVGIPGPCFFTGLDARGSLNIKVNGISNTTLEPKEIRTFQSADEAGIVVSYNFDGTLMDQKIFMTADSPVLWVEWAPDAQSIQAAKKIEVVLSYRPCKVLSNGGKSSSTYKREIKTNLRTIKAHGKYKSYQLRDNENYAILYDANLNPGTEAGRSRKSSADSASALLFDRSNIKSIRFYAGNSYYGTAYLTPGDLTKPFRFGTYKLGKRVGMDEFYRIFEGDPAKFANHKLAGGNSAPAQAE